jgi:hypothetical protein
VLSSSMFLEQLGTISVEAEVLKDSDGIVINNIKVRNQASCRTVSKIDNNIEVDMEDDTMRA